MVDAPLVHSRKWAVSTRGAVTLSSEYNSTTAGRQTFSYGIQQQAGRHLPFLVDVVPLLLDGSLPGCLLYAPGGGKISEGGGGEGGGRAEGDGGGAE